MFETTPCSAWTTRALVKACDAYADVSDAAVDAAIPVACDLLGKLSGEQFMGVCTDTIRPLTSCDPGWPSCGDWPYGPQWFTSYGGGHAFVFDTNMWPVIRPTELLVDGASVDVNVLRVDDGRWIVRTDGRSWPAVQLMHLPTTERGTWSLTVEWGQLPPPSAELAARVLSGELALSCGNEAQCKRCRLSRRVQQVTRSGVSMTLLDPFQFLDKWRLGIMEVDSFLTAYNPGQLQGEPINASAIVRRGHVRKTWPT
jgi:hypothetical protein